MSCPLVSELSFFFFFVEQYNIAGPEESLGYSQRWCPKKLPGLTFQIILINATYVAPMTPEYNIVLLQVRFSLFLVTNFHYWNIMCKSF